VKFETTAQKLIRCRTRLLLGQPFFGTLSLRLKLVPGNSPTMATDGARIVYNPAFVDHLSPAELEGTLAHEVMHCALGHQCRRVGRDPDWSQEAEEARISARCSTGSNRPGSRRRALFT
jgi:predicted metal-dependent peptidase